MLGAGFYVGGCGKADLSFHSMGALSRDPGSDMLWNDPDGDGWGLSWVRVGG